MIRLTTTTQKIQAVLGGAITTNQLPITVSYADKSTTFYTGGVQLTNTNSTTPVDICAAPASGIVRDIGYLSIFNEDTASATCSIIFDNNGTDYTVIEVVLDVGDKLEFIEGSGWKVTTSSGEIKTSGSGGGVSDGDYGDITVSSSGTVWSIDSGVVGTSELADTGVTNAKLNSDVFSSTHTWSAQQTFSAAINNTSSQIIFPATQVASAGVNTLDDYEEGTWTPVLTFATPGNVSVTYSVQAGSYTKIGRLVTASFVIVTSAFTHTTASGACNITGLPFACSDTNMTFEGALQWGGITKTNYTDVNARVSTGASLLLLVASGSGQTTASVDAADMPTGGTVNIRGTLCYHAAT